MTKYKYERIVPEAMKPGETCADIERNRRMAEELRKRKETSDGEDKD